VKDCKDTTDCSGRRDFLVKAAFLTGGLALTLSGASSVFGKPFENVVIKIDAASPLNKVGGSAVVNSSQGKIIVVRTGETSFVAYSAVCTHKGTTIDYVAGENKFVCPNHGSKFSAADGSVANGPARTALASYPASAKASDVTVTVG